MADTGIDRIAKHIKSYGVTVPQTGQDGHYTIEDVTTGISNINSSIVPVRSKSCSATFKTSPLPRFVHVVTIGGQQVGSATGKGYIDMAGNITLS